MVDHAKWKKRYFDWEWNGNEATTTAAAAANRELLNADIYNISL